LLVGKYTVNKFSKKTTVNSIWFYTL